MTLDALVGAEYASLSTQAAVIRRPQTRFLRARGSERVPFLQGQVSSDVRALTEGAGQASLLLTAQGRVEAIVALYDAGDTIEVATEAEHADAVRARLERFLIADDVELEAEEPAGACLALAGPQAPAVLARAQGRPVAEAAGWSRSEGEIAGVPVRIYARGEYRVPFFEIVGAADAGDPTSALTAAGAQTAGVGALEILRVGSGVARYGVDVDASRIALEARLEWAVHFAKGCYVGQEVIERAVSRGRLNRRIVLLASDEPLVVGARVDGGGEHDVVTSSVESPSEGPLALAYVTVGLAEPGTALGVGATAARVLPWPRPEVYAGLRD